MYILYILYIPYIMYSLYILYILYILLFSPFFSMLEVERQLNDDLEYSSATSNKSKEKPRAAEV